jgi:asparagine synthase (glutamine-hydrolysing)
MTGASAQERVFAYLTEAVRKRVDHSDQDEVAVLCSGGIDSAAVACIAASLSSVVGVGNETPKRVRVFTMKYRSGHSDDAFYAGLLCKDLCRNVTHETLEFGPEDLSDETIDAVVRTCETKDPNTVRAAIPMYLLARKIRERAPGVKVVLSGEGADELFGGYGYFRFAPTPEEASVECERLLRNLHMFDLLRADRCFAAHGLEVRVPFLDKDLVAFVSSLPGGVRVAGEKQLLRDAVRCFPALTRCRVLDRPKEKFSDGAGFSYVPDLLRRLAAAAGVDDGVLSTRFGTESAAYAAMFARSYGGCAGSDRWVVERELPRWSGLAEARTAGESGGGLDA